jgi:serine/threonine protein kinase
MTCWFPGRAFADLMRAAALVSSPPSHPFLPPLRLLQTILFMYNSNDVHIVLELCSGGELFDRIVKMGHYSEKDAAKVTRRMLEVIAFCHEMGVIHR